MREITFQTYCILVFVAHGNHRHNIGNGHATLLTMAIDEAALSYEMLFTVSQQNMIDAVKRREDCFVDATLELAGFVWSFEAEKRIKISHGTLASPL